MLSPIHALRKLSISLFLFFGAWQPNFCQDLSKVDERVIDYQDLRLRTPEKLAEQINQDFTTDLEKARAIYAWIAMNIRYDVKAYRKGTSGYSYTYRSQEEKLLKEEQHKKKVANTTFKKRKGVCNGYANLFQNLSELTNLESVIIEGYSKTKLKDIGRNSSKPDHAWNAVKIEDDWLLIDATWGAGSLYRNQFSADYSPIYFDTPPVKFDMKHYPTDTKWLFSDITKKKFSNSPLAYRNYLEADFTIESPVKGTLRIKQEQIIIRIEASSTPKGITYAFNTNKYTTPLAFEESGKYYEAKIPAPKSKSSFLTLYLKNQGIIAYKLQY